MSLIAELDANGEANGGANGGARGRIRDKTCIGVLVGTMICRCVVVLQPPVCTVSHAVSESSGLKLVVRFP